MTATCPSAMAHVDAALERVLRQRELVRREPPSASQSLRMVHLYEREAQLWATLFEHSRVRVYWRAALVAEVCARRYAHLWRLHAAEGLAVARSSPGAVRRGTDVGGGGPSDVSCGGAS